MADRYRGFPYAQDVLAGATDSASESISGVRTVRAFGSEQSRMASYVANVQRSYRLGVKTAVAGGIFAAIMGSVVRFCPDSADSAEYYCGILG